MRSALAGEAHDDEPGVLVRRIGANVGEVKVECDERPLFFLANLGNLGIRTALKPLIPDGQCIMPTIAEKGRSVWREILVKFEAHYAAPDSR